VGGAQGAVVEERRGLDDRAELPHQGRVGDGRVQRPVAADQLVDVHPPSGADHDR
jgi:hypothetical protein